MPGMDLNSLKLTRKRPALMLAVGSIAETTGAEADRLALVERQRVAERAEATRRQEAARAEQDRARAGHEAARVSQRQARQKVGTIPPDRRTAWRTDSDR